MFSCFLHHDKMSLTPTTHPQVFQHTFELPIPSTASIPPSFRIFKPYLVFLRVFTYCHPFSSPMMSHDTPLTSPSHLLDQPPIFEPTHSLVTPYLISSLFLFFQSSPRVFTRLQHLSTVYKCPYTSLNLHSRFRDPQYNFTLIFDHFRLFDCFLIKF